MLQRIQSIYLSLTAILSVVFISMPLMKFEDPIGQTIIMNITGLQKATEQGTLENIGSTIPLSVLLLFLPFFASGVIFFYKNRILQQKLTIALFATISLSMIILTYYVLTTCRTLDIEFLPGLNLGIPVLMLVLVYLAYRGIKKDEKLVRSYDRLR